MTGVQTCALPICFPVTIGAPPKNVANPVTSKVPPIVVLLLTSKSSPIYKSFPMPTPPSITKAPEVLLVESVVSFKLTTPVTSKVPPIVVLLVTSKLSPTYKSLAIPTPPSTTKAPEVLLVAFVVSFKLTSPVTSKVLKMLLIQ